MFRALARPLLASWFIYDGLGAALEPETRAQEAEHALAPVYELLDVHDAPPASTLVRAHAIATVGAAVVLATSRTPRTAGLALATLAAVQLAATKRPWEMPAGPERDAAIEDFIRHGALLGGAMLAASVGHTAGHTRRKKARRAKAKAASASSRRW